LFDSKDLKIILNQSSVRQVINCASDYYLYRFHNIPLKTKFETFEDQVIKKFTNLNEKFTNLDEKLANLDEIKDKLGKIEKNLHSLNNQNIKASDTTNSKDITTSNTKNIHIKNLSSKSIENILPSIENVLPIDINRNNPKRNSKRNEINPKIHEIIEYLKNQKNEFEKKYQQKEIIDSTNDIGKLRTIILMYKQLKDLTIDQLRIGKKKLPEHLAIKLKKFSYAIGFLHESGNSFTSRLKNFNQLTINRDEFQFRLFRDERESKIKSKVAKEEKDKFNNSKNGEFIIMNKESRIIFELIYKIVVDIQNKDIDFDLKETFKVLNLQFPDYWLIKFLNI